MDVSRIVSSLDFTAGLEAYLRGGHVIWAYAVLAATTAPPLVPNAALLVAGGVLAAQGRLSVALVLLVVAGSALAGDLLIHRSGRAVSGRVLARLYRRPKRRALLEWAALRIQRYGVPFVIGVRFLPSGRLVGGIAAGIVRYPARRYMAGAGIAEAVWATYSVGLGYFGGRATSNSVYAVGIGLGVSLLVAAVGGGIQLIAGRRARQHGQVARSPELVVAAGGGATATVPPSEGAKAGRADRAAPEPRCGAR